ncbi:hypothetical protein PMZ80_010993 [Knufia obscura]|uniref:Uncharacterized protein n=1 Tax=Knufia obscura TaxID=1635080 RepID=A0ABR0R7X6_9EURO|nr:hypothetical protein PMZ80_010993 [Knufia obscura]
MVIDTATPRHRNIKLSTKARETQRVNPLSFRDIETAEDDDEYVDEDDNENKDEGNGKTALQTLVKLVTTLKRTIERQNAIIKNVEAQLSEIETEQQALRAQNGELQDEMRTLRNMYVVRFRLSSTKLDLAVSQFGPALAQGKIIERDLIIVGTPSVG